MFIKNKTRDLKFRGRCIFHICNLLLMLGTLGCNLYQIKLLKVLEFIEIYVSRFPTCLPVAPIDMKAIVDGSGEIQLEPSLETGRVEE